MKIVRYMAAGFALMILAGVAAFAVTDGIPWGRDNTNRNFTKKVWMDDTLYLAGAGTLASTLDVTGLSTLGSLSVSGVTGLTGNLTRKGEVLTNSAVALASPTVTFSAASKGLITLTTTGTYTPTVTSITGGALNQIITIIPGAGADAMTFANCTSITLPATIVLTEGSTTGEAMSLRCTSADGDDWTLYALPGTTVSGTTGTYSGVVTAAGFTIGSAAIVEAELETIDTITAGTAVANKAAILGATYNLDQLNVATLTVPTSLVLSGAAITRTAQIYTFTDMKVSNAGGTDWVITDDSNKATLAASQTSETLIVKITGLHAGDIITKLNLLGQVEDSVTSAGVVIDADLRVITSAAGDLTDTSVGTIVRPTIADDTALNSTATHGVSATLAHTVTSDQTFYVRVTGTTVASTDIALQGVQITVTQK